MKDNMITNNFFIKNSFLDYLSLEETNFNKIEFNNSTNYVSYTVELEKILNGFIGKINGKSIHLKVAVIDNIRKPEIVYGDKIINGRRNSRWLSQLSKKKYHEMDVVLLVPFPTDKKTNIDIFFVLFNALHLLALLIINKEPDTIKDNLYLTTIKVLINRLTGDPVIINNLWVNTYILWIQNKMLMRPKIEKVDFIKLEMEDVITTIKTTDSLSGYFLENFDNFNFLEFKEDLPTDSKNILDFCKNMNSKIFLQNIRTVGKA